MSAYSLAVKLMAIAALIQITAAILSTEVLLRKRLDKTQKLYWLALDVGALLFALQSVYALELALRTGLFDLRQSLLSGLISWLFAYAIYQLRKQSGMPPPP